LSKAAGLRHCGVTVELRPAGRDVRLHEDLIDLRGSD
jgi:hypothetical protein